LVDGGASWWAVADVREMMVACVMQGLAKLLSGRIKLEDAGFDWKVRGMDDGSHMVHQSHSTRHRSTLPPLPPL
jgi:hypothetical protein